MSIANILVENDLGLYTGSIVIGDTTTATPLSYYEDIVQSSSFGGAIGATNAFVRIVRVGAMVTVTVLLFTGTGAGANTIFATGALPARFRPISTVISYALVNNDSVILSGTIGVEADGTIRFGLAANTSFAGIGVTGLAAAATISYSI